MKSVSTIFFKFATFSFAIFNFGQSSFASSEFSAFSVQSTIKDGETLQHLMYGNQQIGILQSSGAKAAVLKVRKLKSPKPSKLFEVLYSAGGGGTHTFSYVQRIAVVEINENDLKKSKIPIDFLSEIRREKGDSTLITLDRKYKWTLNPLSLSLEEFDEEPETTYFWVKDHFEAKAKELDLELDEN